MILGNCWVRSLHLSSRHTLSASSKLPCPHRLQQCPAFLVCFLSVNHTENTAQMFYSYDNTISAELLHSTHCNRMFDMASPPRLVPTTAAQLPTLSSLYPPSRSGSRLSCPTSTAHTFPSSGNAAVPVGISSLNLTLAGGRPGRYCS
ncbi:hypothetical protein C8R48DRAFT_223341 [Suillus tomentosus]|nr:hypothetical protein C8R48DRAFT_223341 [Suillus tomentosus]